MIKQYKGYPSNNPLFWLFMIAVVVRMTDLGLNNETKKKAVYSVYVLMILYMLYNVLYYPKYRVFFVTRFLPLLVGIYFLVRLAGYLAREPFNMNMYDACINACNEGCPNWNRRAMTRCWACCGGNPTYLERCVVDCSQA